MLVPVTWVCVLDFQCSVVHLWTLIYNELLRLSCRTMTVFGGGIVVMLMYLLPSLLFLFQSTTSESSLFDHLINIWEFSPGPNPGTCNLYFFVDFKFNSPLYRQVNVPSDNFVVVCNFLRTTANACNVEFSLYLRWAWLRKFS